MRKMTKSFLMLLITAVVLVLVTSAWGEQIDPPIATGFRNIPGVQLVQDETWVADLSTYANWTAELHCITGWYTADIMYSNEPQVQGWPFPDDSGFFILSRSADAKDGSVIYKFVAPSGLVTAAGGTVSTLGVMFTGYPNKPTFTTNLWFGINDEFQLSAGEPAYAGIANAAAFTKVRFGSEDADDPDDPDEWGTYFKDMTLDIPVGVSEFYVAVSEDYYSSGRLGVGNLTVDAQFIPEPATVILLGFGGIAMLRRKK